MIEQLRQASLTDQGLVYSCSWSGWRLYRPRPLLLCDQSHHCSVQITSFSICLLGLGQIPTFIITFINAASHQDKRPSLVTAFV